MYNLRSIFYTLMKSVVVIAWSNWLYNDTSSGIQQVGLKSNLWSIEFSSEFLCILYVAIGQEGIRMWCLHFKVHECHRNGVKTSFDGQTVCWWSYMFQSWKILVMTCKFTTIHKLTPNDFVCHKLFHTFKNLIWISTVSSFYRSISSILNTI